jgi:hypothetical protein
MSKLAITVTETKTLAKLIGFITFDDEQLGLFEMFFQKVLLFPSLPSLPKDYNCCGGCQRARRRTLGWKPWLGARPIP